MRCCFNVPTSESERLSLRLASKQFRMQPASLARSQLVYIPAHPHVKTTLWRFDWTSVRWDAVDESARSQQAFGGRRSISCRSLEAGPPEQHKGWRLSSSCLVINFFFFLKKEIVKTSGSKCEQSGKQAATYYSDWTIISATLSATHILQCDKMLVLCGKTRLFLFFIFKSKRISISATVVFTLCIFFLQFSYLIFSHLFFFFEAFWVKCFWREACWGFL